MPTTSASIRTQAQRLQNAIAHLAPPSTISLLRRLNRAEGALSLPALAEQALWMSEAQLEARLAAMEESGLVRRGAEAGGTVVALNRAGREALYIQMPFARWASAHQGAPEAGIGPVPYTEQALATLNRAHAVATILALAAEGEPVYPSEFADLALPADMGLSNLYPRLAQLQKDGLVERTGEPRNYLYSLTEAGKSLSEPLEAVGRWAQRHLAAPARVPTPRRPAAALALTPAPVFPAPAPAPAPAVAGAGPAAQAASRAGAATLRSASARLVFSHKPAPQPVPPIAAAAAQRR
ncbi:hypothetical protein KNE206_53320 [Kitasatospora sp. NE20-6]|uniref:winged helix-turn-helix transcriptional regulator n=1 Tax=Kitasatospora sp. NE20-6 TaxID=2859066 RepID=UPI0034DCAA4B